MDIQTFLLTQLFTLAGIGMLFGAWFINRISKRDEEQCTYKTQALVTDNIKESSTDSNGHHSHSYHPVLEFTAANGTYVKTRSIYGTGSIKYPTGSCTTVWYDPHDPSHFFTDNHGTFRKVPVLIFGMIGIVLLPMGLIFGYLAATGVLS